MADINMHQQAPAPILALVVPCYNDEEVLPDTHSKLAAKLQSLTISGKIRKESFILLVDDGSADGTWDVIQKICSADKGVRGVKLSRNFGHQGALLAGLVQASAVSDCSISLDSDLQDDINVIDMMVDKYMEGCEIVYGVRTSRQIDSFLKRTTANAFYRLMSAMGAKTIHNHADCRLSSSRVINELMRYREVNLYLRGIFPLLGFKTGMVYYERKQRMAGQTGYTVSKLLALALDGITSFSVRPLRLVMLAGFLVCMMSIVLGAYALYAYLVRDIVRGWTSIVLPIYFLGGVQMLCIGVLGEYIGKIYKETKQRPAYTIEKTI